MSNYSILIPLSFFSSTGIWTSSLTHHLPPFPPQTPLSLPPLLLLLRPSSLRRVPPTLSILWPRRELRLYCRKLSWSLFWLTLLAEPTPGTRWYDIICFTTCLVEGAAYHPTVSSNWFNFEYLGQADNSAWRNLIGHVHIFAVRAVHVCEHHFDDK